VNFKKLNVVCFYISILILVSAYPVNAQMNDQSNEFPQPDIEHVLHSQNIEQTYTIYIYLPDNYHTSEIEYQAFYVLDGDASLDELAVQEITKINNKSIVIGIGYGEEASVRRPSRLRDLTPKPIAELNGTGGGKKFHFFLKNSLIPFVQNKYRVNLKKSTLIGHSLSGYFVLYSLFSEPNLFDNYISISPSIAIDDLKIERNTYKNESYETMKLFLAAGGGENRERMLIPFKEFRAELKTRTYEGLVYKYLIIDNMDHFSVVRPALSEGLKWILNENRARAK